MIFFHLPYPPVVPRTEPQTHSEPPPPLASKKMGSVYPSVTIGTVTVPRMVRTDHGGAVAQVKVWPIGALVLVALVGILLCRS